MLTCISFEVTLAVPFGFTVKIREPLLAAIGELQKHIA